MGARNLGAFLNGVSASRGWSGGEHLSVVGHSYGTTTATLATARTPVSNLTLLASAGVDTSLPSVSEVDVPRNHVWASQANDDYIANIGRGSLEVRGFERDGLQPSVVTRTRSQTLEFYSQHPLNPADEDWGARTFSADDETIDGTTYVGSDGHAATPATEALQNHESVRERGYLDSGTSPLRNTAYTSLGYTPDGKKIP